MVVHTAPSTVFAFPMEEGISTSNLLNTAFRNSDYIIFCFLVFLGIVDQLYRDRQGVTARHVFALFSLLTFLIFIPDISTIISPLFLAYRLPLMISPIIAFALAAGVLALIPNLEKYKSAKLKAVAVSGLSLLLILMYSFSSLFLLAGQTDVNLTKLGQTTPRRYFTEAELASFGFLAQDRGDITIYTDAHSSVYFESKYKLTTNGTIDTLKVVGLKQSGYLLLRKEALDSWGILVFDPRGTSALYHGVTTYRLHDEPDIEVLWQTKRLIYCNRDVQIYLK
jgi:hypothetical protein